MAQALGYPLSALRASVQESPIVGAGKSCPYQWRPPSVGAGALRESSRPVYDFNDIIYLTNTGLVFKTYKYPSKGVRWALNLVDGSN